MSNVFLNRHQNDSLFSSWIHRENEKNKKIKRLQEQLDAFLALGSYERVAHLISLGEIAEHSNELELPDE